MRGHPGAEENSRRMIALSGLAPGASILDLGAGAGETVALLRALGYEVGGIDLAPRGAHVKKGDLLRVPAESGGYDGLISQCAFYLSGDIPAAFREAYRLLRPGGVLMYTDVCFAPARPIAEAAGFEIRYYEDMSALWREYYIEALWRGTADCCGIKARCGYEMLICGKD